jgi:hypothetical protein
VRDRRFARHSPQLVVATFLAHIVRSSILETCLQARLIETRRTDRRQHRQPTAVPHSGRTRREPLTRGRPTERRFPGCADPRRGGRFLDPERPRSPRSRRGRESFSVFRIARRLGPGQALTRVGAVLLRGHGHADHFSTGRCHAKRGGASEQKCTLHTGCIERCPSEIGPRWAPLSCWRGRPGARRVAHPRSCSSAISRSLPAACLPARSPIPMLSTTAGTSSGRWRLRDRLCSRLNEGDHLVSGLSPLLRT